jgi:hypothetical protein
MRLDASSWARAGLVALALTGAMSMALPAGAQRIVVLDDDKPSKSSNSKSTVDITLSPHGKSIRIHVDADSNRLDASADSAQQGREAYEWQGSSRSTAHSSDDKVTFGQDLYIPADKVIAGDAVCIFGSIKVDGVVSGDVVSIGGDVTLGENAVVRGDCVAVGGGSIRTGADSQIHGEAVAVGGHIFDSPGAHIAKRVEMSFVPAFRTEPSLFIRGGWWVFLAHFLFIGLIGYVLVRLASARWANAVLSLKTRGLESLLAGIGAGIIYGILGLPLLAAIVVAMVAVVVGIPLVPIVIFAILILPIPGYLVTGTLIGGAARRGQSGADPARGPAGPAGPIVPVGPADSGRAYLLGHAFLSAPWLLSVLLRSLIGSWFSFAGAFLILGFCVIWLAIAFGWGAILLSRFGRRLPPAMQARLDAEVQARGAVPPSAPLAPSTPPES